MISADSFKEKAGPLPVWGWSVIIAVGGYVLYRYYKNKQTAAQSNQSPGAVTTGINTQNVPSNMLVEDPALMEQLNDTNAGLATLATNVGKQTTATDTNTTAVNNNTTTVKQAPTQIAGAVKTAITTPQFYDKAQALAMGLKYTRDATTGAVYQIGPTGLAYHLSPAEYASLGKPRYTDYNTVARPAPKPAPAPVAKPRLSQYVVRSGDNLFNIAKSHGISLASLEAANRQIKNYNLIYPGQRINIP